MIRLMDHQRRLVSLCCERSHYGVGWEPGLGKTIGTYAVISDAKSRGFVGRTVVVCPKSIMYSAWAADAKHFADLTAVVCWAETAAKRRKLIDTPNADVLILNYEAFKSHADDLREWGRVTRLVVDESSKLRNDRSAISRAAFEFSRYMSSVYLLSGTPAPNGAEEYFGQVRCISPGLFGPNFWRFANTYFTPQRRMINGVERIIGWRMLPNAKAAFTAKLQSVWWTLRAVDCLDLPAETDVVRDVSMDADEARCYVQILQELKAEFDDGRISEFSASARMMKLRQITGGNLYESDGSVRAVGRSKLDALLELLEELGPDRPVVIWAEFTAEIDRITSELHAAGYSAGKIDGSVSAGDRADLIEAFQKGNLHCLVCHPAAAGHGITLTAARCDVFYSIGFQPENHDQARKRIHRIGQHWPVTHFYLLATNSVDHKVLKVLEGKATASEAMKELLSGAATRREEMVA